MIQITEQRLREAIQISLGSEGIHTIEIENDLIYDIKTLSTSKSSISLSNLDGKNS